MPPMGKGPGGKKMPSGGPKPKNMKKTLGTLLRYLGKYKVFLAIVLVLVVFNSFAMVAGSYFLKPLVNNYILPGDFAGLAKMLMVLGSIFLAGALSAYGYARLMVHVSQNTIRDIRRDLFNKMQDLPIKYFDTHTHGELMSRFTNDVDTLREAISQGVTQLMTSTVSVVGTFIMMLVLSPLLTLLIIFMLFIMLFMNCLMKDTM